MSLLLTELNLVMHWICHDVSDAEDVFMLA
jgi:hypothetical protein